MTIKIPISPHLKKFAVKYFEADKEQVIQLAQRSSLNNMVNYAVIAKEKRKGDIKYTEELEIELPARFCRSRPRRENLIILNSLIDSIFKDAMRHWIIAQYYEGNSYFSACRGFLEYYKIKEIEYAPETAYRDWQRWHNKEYKRKNIPN